MESNLEKQFRLALRQHDIFDHKVQALCFKLRDALEYTLLTDFEAALVQNTEANLWKLTHYKTIEEYRKRLKLLGSKKKSEDRNEYRILSSHFRSFLTEASGFYISLIIKIHCLHGIVETSIISDLQLIWQDQSDYIVEPKPLSKQHLEKLDLVVYRSLIYLGDLARYREIHADKKKQWGLCRKFYGLANSMMPWMGNPYNQLAVLDTYCNQELSAIAMYFKR